MLTTSDAFARAHGAIFRIPIEPISARDWWWGTGFFVSADGHALTAFHNLPSIVAASRCGEVQGVDADGQPFPLDYIPMDGDKERDIALLRVRPEDRRSFPHLPIAALPDDLSGEERVRFWAGRAELVCGFPIGQLGQEEEPIAGHLRGDGPFGIEDEKDYWSAFVLMGEPR